MVVSKMQKERIENRHRELAELRSLLVSNSLFKDLYHSAMRVTSTCNYDEKQHRYTVMPVRMEDLGGLVREIECKKPDKIERQPTNTND